jgi:hypothetical protein
VSKARRDLEKKRRREKRKSKGIGIGTVRGLESALLSLQNLDTPEPKTWPGACHPVLARPDHLKYEIAGVIGKAGRPAELCKQLERQLQQGLLSPIESIDHWGMEEFLSHGMPDGSYHPIDAFLGSAGDRFPPAAREQLLLWKQARIGIFHVGDVADDTVALREWDPVSQCYRGAAFRAIALNIGGVEFYREQKGLANVTYVAPWVPERDLYCVMGYGLAVPKEFAPAMELLVRGMRNLAAVTLPLPWKAGRVAQKQCLEEWRRRDWHGWMQERVSFPFTAVVFFENGRTDFARIDRMITKDAAQAREMGMYFGGLTHANEALGAGATAMTPIDVGSRTSMAFAEYHEYRRLVGPASRRVADGSRLGDPRGGVSGSGLGRR